MSSIYPHLRLPGQGSRGAGAARGWQAATAPLFTLLLLFCGDLGVITHRATGPSPSRYWSQIQASSATWKFWCGWRSQSWECSLLSQGCFWGRDGDRILPHHGSLTLGSPHTLLSGVLNWQWDAPSLHHTSLAAFHFPRDSRTDWGDPAQPFSSVPLPLSPSAWRSGRAGESHAGRTQWEIFGPEWLGKLSSLPVTRESKTGRGREGQHTLIPHPLCL